MDYRLGTPDDLDEVVSLVEGAKRLMSAQGINQWDDIYPCREDFESDIKKSNLYVVLQEEKIAAVYVISEECDDIYPQGVYTCHKDTKKLATGEKKSKTDADCCVSER